MEKRKKTENELVTKGYLDHTLRYRFGRFHTKIKQEIREESRALEFRLTQSTNNKFAEIDRRFDAIERKIDAQNDYIKDAVDKVFQLADKVIGVHKNFELESASIKHNYSVLEERVKKVEVVIFPEQQS